MFRKSTGEATRAAGEPDGDSHRHLPRRLDRLPEAGSYTGSRVDARTVIVWLDSCSQGAC